MRWGVLGFWGASKKTGFSQKKQGKRGHHIKYFSETLKWQGVLHVILKKLI